MRDVRCSHTSRVCGFGTYVAMNSPLSYVPTCQVTCARPLCQLRRGMKRASSLLPSRRQLVELSSMRLFLSVFVCKPEATTVESLVLLPTAPFSLPTVQDAPSPFLFLGDPLLLPSSHGTTPYVATPNIGKSGTTTAAQATGVQPETRPATFTAEHVRNLADVAGSPSLEAGLRRSAAEQLRTVLMSPGVPAAVISEAKNGGEEVRKPGLSASRGAGSLSILPDAVAPGAAVVARLSLLSSSGKSPFIYLTSKACNPLSTSRTRTRPLDDRLFTDVFPSASSSIAPPPTPP